MEIFAVILDLAATVYCVASTYHDWLKGNMVLVWLGVVITILGVIVLIYGLYCIWDTYFR